ncbi:MAG: XrtA system polysaccharide chain length determinant [Burkholderiaceae bacterium]
MEELITQLLSLVKGVWKYRWYAVVVAWVIVVIGWIVVYRLPDNYQASARVYVDTQSILQPLLSGMTSMPNVDQQVSIMSRTLLSRPNIERAMRMVDLDLKAKTVKEQEKYIDDLMAQIKISGTMQDDIYTIAYSNANPKLAKDVVQSFLTIFVEGSFGDKKQDSEKAVRFIDEQIKNYEDKLVAAENSLKDFKLKNASMMSRPGSDYGSKMIETTDLLNQARLELMEAEQSRDAIKKQIGGDDSIGKGDATPAKIVNPELDERIQALNKNLDTLRLQYTEQYPDIISTKHLIAQLEARKVEEAKLKKNSDPGLNYSPMLQQLKVSLSQAEARVAGMRARVDEYNSRIYRMKALSNAAPELETQLAQLNRDYLINKDNYEKLVSRRDAAKLSGELSATTQMMTFRVIDPPTVPLAPAGPKRLLLASLVFVGAIFAGIGAAFLMSQIRPTFLSQSSLREATGLPILGTVAMNWTDNQKINRRKSLYAFGASFISLLVLYGGVMTIFILKQ